MGTPLFPNLKGIDHAVMGKNDWAPGGGGHGKNGGIMLATADIIDDSAAVVDGFPGNGAVAGINRQGQGC